jgi:single-strand DNA-binding protein
MADQATITITGRLTRNPETTETKTSAVAKFSLAVNGFKKEDVSFFECEAWGKVGAIVQEHCKKGKQIAVTGTIRINWWEDKEGNKRSKPIVNVWSMTLLGSKDESKATEPQQQQAEIEQNDIPF